MFMNRTILRLAKSKHANRWFLRRSTAADRPLRAEILRQFERVERYIPCHHEPREMLLMADYILGRASDGPLVERGCYKGGSSAKLSLIAAATGRTLYVCDSFQGLPAVSATESSFRNVDGVENAFSTGGYAATIETVRSNIVRAGGDLSCCVFVPGFFSDSLPKLSVNPAFIFSDADLISSTRDVLRNLWPQLKRDGRFHTHDANLLELVKGILDPHFWARELSEFPPIMFGAGHGCGLWAGGLGYCEKGESVAIHTVESLSEAYISPAS